MFLCNYRLKNIYLQIKSEIKYKHNNVAFLVFTQYQRLHLLPCPNQ